MSKFCSLASGSSGNSVFVEHKGSKILIDCGFSGRKIENLLSQIGENPSDLDAIFLTHEHMDHVKGAGVISRRYDIPIYANKGTWLSFIKNAGKLKEENIKIFRSNSFLNFNSFDIFPISIHHDANEPVGFILYLDNKKITVLTDTGIIDDRILNEIKGSDVYYFEANHDLDALKRGPYTYPMKVRIMGKMGHLSNDQSAKFLADAIQGKNEKIFLAHLSETNNSEELCKITVDNYLKSCGLDTSRDIKLEVAKRHAPSSIVELWWN